MENFEFYRPTVLTVSGLSNYLRELLETDDVLQDVWVKGEISNFSQPRSGHLYFTLKDNEAQIRAVMWKSSALRLNFSPRDGQSVEVHGSMSFYPASGQAQLYVDTIQPVGEGQLFQDFIRLKNKLEAEGLFDPRHKKDLPQIPKQIGVITSATGAALQDILNTLNRRLPSLQVIIAPSQVQGADSPASLLKSLAELSQTENLDLIILARGGGSIEDLWAFNDESLARAIYNCPIPLITGIGHETDFTIADFVADFRAPTPTAAAELATPITINDLNLTLLASRNLLQDKIKEIIAMRIHELELRKMDLRRLSPIQQVNNAIQKLDNLQLNLDHAIQRCLDRNQQNTSNLATHLDSLNPLAVLKRGFAIVNDAETGQLISRAIQSLPNQTVTIHFADSPVPAKLKPYNQEES
jgi:exodeoxyribonuclease VII large subunit